MVDELLVSTAEKVFANTCTFDAIEAAERDAWAPGVWAALAEVGLPWVSVPESAGGVGGSLADALAVLTLAGRFAAPVPLAETGVLAGWLLASAGLAVGEGPATVAPGWPADSLRLDDAGRLNGVLHGVPWARAAERIVVLVAGSGGSQVAVVNPAATAITTHPNLAGEPRDTVHLDNVVPESLAPSGLSEQDYRRRGALTRVALAAGALGKAGELSLRYTSERKQFGQAVRRFQLVQAHLVHTAQDAELVAMACAAATAAVEAGAGDFEIATARAVTAAATQSATRSAHQAHGAMGMTREYPLHHFTRRLWAWRTEFGDEQCWNGVVFAAARAADPDELWYLIANGSRPNR